MPSQRSEDAEDVDTVPITITYDTEDGTVVFSWRRLLMFSGPGLLMSIAYVDPGNLESDLQTGAQTGYMLGWLILWSTVLGFIVQLLAVRLGIVTKKHLAQHCRTIYPPVPRFVLWIMMEVAIIGSDIQEVIGSAIAIQLLSSGRVPIWAGVLITGVDTFFLLSLERLGVRKLEAFFGILVATMTISFGVMYYQAECPTGEVIVGTLLPRIKGSQLSIAVGIVGALVMPHNVFLHSALVQSRQIDDDLPGAKREAILYNAIESAVSLSITVVINIFVMAVFAVGFYNEEGKQDVGLSTAGEYLGEQFGPAMKYVWAIGLFAAGQSSTMTGTYTGQFVMSGFMEIHLPQWKRALVTRSVALAPTLAVAIAYAGTNEMDTLNQNLNVLQSMQLPFALIPVLYASTRADIMGERFVTRSLFKHLVQAICAVLLLVNLTTVAVSVQQGITDSLLIGLLLVVYCTAYAAFVVYLLVGPVYMYHHATLSQVAWVRVALGWLGRAVSDDSELQVDTMPLVNGDASGSAADQAVLASYTFSSSTLVDDEL